MFAMSKKETSTDETPTMDSSKKEKSTKAVNNAHSNTTTLISAGTEIIGDIKFCGHLEIEGKITGNIMTADIENAVVRIMEKGEIQGDITVPSITVNGSIQGNIVSSDQVQLAQNARVEGDIQYKLIEMAKGARIYGRLLHQSHRSAKAPGGNVEPVDLSPHRQVKAQ